MDLKQKIKFVNDLIRENPEITLAEYLASVQEVETIEKTQTDMGRTKGTPNLTKEQKKEVLSLAAVDPAEKIAEDMGISLDRVYKICARKAGSIVKARKAAAPPEPIPIGPRPAAEYSNQGFLSTAQKYAV